MKLLKKVVDFFHRDYLCGKKEDEYYNRVVGENGTFTIDNVHVSEVRRTTCMECEHKDPRLGCDLDRLKRM
ncbi:MAG: hypothetical protein FWE31_02420 [Firmicutes bacterium]|nr:hypothetical protein [Bacillota bacterium]